MKKYIIGFIAGILAASAFPVYGAVTSMVGKQVQAENAVVVNGNELDVKSVNIDGTTYTPNRALADALGMDIKFENNTVIFEEKVDTVETPRVSEEPIQDTSGIQVEIDSINARISEIIKARNEYMTKRTQLMAEYNIDIDRREEIQKETEILDSEMKKLIEEKEQLEKRRSELQAQLQQTP